MKFSIIALLPAISLAATVAKRNNGQLLPTVQGDVSGFTKDGAESHPGVPKNADQGAKDAANANWWWCDDDYPFWSDGFCCHYNRYCGRECCGHWATFCGVDGYCYY
ncbi:hypothetical protein PWT90_03729 [Aphanocladium album]|nr:hypothetical protein PWT90_03729 [Aphanocladium album]